MHAMHAKACLIVTFASIACSALEIDGGNCSLSTSQKLAAMSLTNLFENGRFDFDYEYCENINDGRGVTAGFAGFTTADGDALDVIQAYTVQHPSNSLAKYIPALKLLALNSSDSISLLAGYCKAWMNEAKQTAFQNIQMAEVTTTYYQPSQQMADALGVQYALSRAFLYDTIIQHGGGDDGDSLAAIVNRTNTELGGSPAEGVDETIWLPAMISKRREDLLHPDNAATADQWAQSTDRTDVYAQLVATSQWALAGAVHFNTTDYPDESLATNNTMATNSANCGTRSEVNATTESFMDLASPISGGSSLFLASSTVLGALTLSVLLLS